MEIAWYIAGVIVVAIAFLVLDAALSGDKE